MLANKSNKDEAGYMVGEEDSELSPLLKSDEAGAWDREMEESGKGTAELSDELIRLRLRIAEAGRKEGARLKVVESADRQRTPASGSGAAIAKDGVLLHVDERFLEIFGYGSAHKIVGRPISMLVHQTDRDRVSDFSIRPIPYEFLGVREDGTPVYVEANVTNTSFGNESVSLISLRDVTRRKQNLETLEKRLRVEEFISAISTRFIDVPGEEIEKRICDALGTVGEFTETDDVHLMLFPLNGTLPQRGYHWCRGKGEPRGIEKTHLLPSPWAAERLAGTDIMNVPGKESLPLEAGAEREAWEALGIVSILAISLNSAGRPIGCIAFPAYEKESRWAEEDLMALKLAGEIFASVLTRKESAEVHAVDAARSKAILQAIPDEAFRARIDGTILDYKPGVPGLVASPDQVAGRKVADLGLPRELARDVIASVREAVDSGGMRPAGRTVVRAGGRTFEVSAAKTGNDEAVCVVRDISDLRAAEQAREESENRFMTLAGQPTLGVFLIQDNLFKYVNGRFAAIFGYGADGMTTDKGLEDLASPEDRPAVAESIRKTLSGEIQTLHCEFTGLREDGGTVSAEAHGSVVSHNGRPAVVGTLLDESDRKKLEAHLIQSERMNAIGTLAGGIAHDFNNILMAIQGYTSLMLHHLDSSHPHFGKLQGIEELVESGSDLTKQLLGFASGGTYETKPTDMNGIVRKTSTMFARTRREIAIQARYESDPCVVDADSGQIEQMLLNLYVNAWQAMPDGGTLVLATENVTLDRKFARPYSVKPGKYAKISVTDSGVGMDEATKERIFEPFFTTKKRSMGTGLGLSSVYKIVKGHNGIITVTSEKGSGSTFCIYLPRSKRSAEKVEPASQAVLKGVETVLLVDDEETVVSVSRDMLEALGYSVLVAKSGQEAIAIFEKEHNRIDLVILDVIMPDMGGAETFDEMRRIDPSAKVILSSGYSIDGLATKIMERGCEAFIQKPFTINLLSQKLRDVLGRG
jgi:two-component system, cell cycle sensor histidine kinase and response regulator CckA